MARPSDIDGDMLRAIAECVTAGLTNKATADLLGISSAAFYRWGQRGRAELAERDDPWYPRRADFDPYCDFVEVFENARAECLRNALTTIQDFARGWDSVTQINEEGQGADGKTFARSTTKVTTIRSWQAAAWIAERIDPENYGRTNRTVLSSNPEQPVEVHHTIEEVDVAALARVVNVLTDAGILAAEPGPEDPAGIEPGPDPERAPVEVRPADPD